MSTKSKNTNDYAIRSENVAADYGEGDVISAIEFDVRRGETFGLMGLNGAGKTTFIKILLGLMEPSKGTVKIEGRETLDPETKYKIAYLPEKFEPPFFLSGMEFVRFSLTLYKKGFDENRVLEAADRLALSRDALYRRVNTYSKGMRQKLGLLGTLLTDCPLMILDEPMSGLDPRARARVKDEILDCRRRGITVFLSSHILADMDEICDRVSVIDDGKLKFVGTPAGLRKDTKQDYLERAFLTLIDGKAPPKKPATKKTSKKTAAKSTSAKTVKKTSAATGKSGAAKSTTTRTTKAKTAEGTAKTTRKTTTKKTGKTATKKSVSTAKTKAPSGKKTTTKSRKTPARTKSDKT